MTFHNAPRFLGFYVAAYFLLALLAPTNPVVAQSAQPANPCTTAAQTPCLLPTVILPTVLANVQATDPVVVPLVAQQVQKAQMLPSLDAVFSRSFQQGWVRPTLFFFGVAMFGVAVFVMHLRNVKFRRLTDRFHCRIPTMVRHNGADMELTMLDIGQLGVKLDLEGRSLPGKSVWVNLGNAWIRGRIAWRNQFYAGVAFDQAQPAEFVHQILMDGREKARSEAAMPEPIAAEIGAWLREEEGDMPEFIVAMPSISGTQAPTPHVPPGPEAPRATRH